MSLSANPNQLKTGEIGKQFAPFCGGELADQLQVLFPDGDDRRCFHHHPSARCSVTCRQHERSKKRSWKTGVQTWLLLEVDKHLSLLHLSCLFLVVLLMCCNVFPLKPTRSMWAAFSLPRFFNTFGVSRRFFPRFPVLHCFILVTRA